MKRRLIQLSIFFLVLVGFLSLVVPPLSALWETVSQTPIATRRLQPPTLVHWMGTDALGRDLWVRIWQGARVSLSLATLSTLFAFVFGTGLGALAGYFSDRFFGLLDRGIMRLTDLFYAFPSTLLAILLTIPFGKGSLGILVALCISSWMTQARLTRALVLQAKKTTYIEAATAVGTAPLAIVIKHMLPNFWKPLSINILLQVPSSISTESFLSFIGLGIQPPTPSWGSLVQEGFRAMQTYPHLILFPAGILFLTLFCLHIVALYYEQQVKRD